MNELYILTDSTGFTTCCAPNAEAELRETGRRPMLAPITVHHWKRVNGSGEKMGWKLLRTWGGTEPWR
jgi:hypothetical protein